MRAVLTTSAALRLGPVSRLASPTMELRDDALGAQLKAILADNARMKQRIEQQDQFIQEVLMQLYHDPMYLPSWLAE